MLCTRRMSLAIAVATFVTITSAAARTIEFDAATIADINAAFDAGTLTSEALTRLCLARIAAFDRTGPALHAVMALNPRAIEQARGLDAERKAKGRRSALHGIHVVLKDNYDTFDMPTTNSSLSFIGPEGPSIPPDDAYLVRRLREAGAIFLGKTNMHEFARGITTISSLGGQTLNPYALSRNPGGSSGGTGAAMVSSKEHAGLPSEMGLAEAHQALVVLALRGGSVHQDHPRSGASGMIEVARHPSELDLLAAHLGSEGPGEGAADALDQHRERLGDRHSAWTVYAQLGGGSQPRDHYGNRNRPLCGSEWRQPLHGRNRTSYPD